MTDLARAWASLPQISGVHASGDGRWAFFCLAGPGETEDVWCVATDGSSVPERLTRGDDHFLIRDVSHDGRRLVLAQSERACEHDRLWLLDRDRADALVPLTAPQRSHYVFGGVFTDDEAGVIFAADYDYDAGAPAAGGCLWRQELATGARTCLLRTDTPFDTGPRLSPDGRTLMWERHDREPGGTQIWLIGADGSDPRKVLDLGPRNAVRADWAGNDRIAFVADEGGRDRLGLLEIATGAVRWLAGEPEILPHEVLAGAGDGFAVIVHDRPHSRALVWTGAGLAPLPNRSGRRSLLPVAKMPDGGWLAEAYDADAPHALVRILPDGACVTLTAFPADPLCRFTRPEDFRWTAPDGRPMQGWLYLPGNAPRGLIALIHGGPTWHSEDWVNPKIQFWVQSGYAVLDPNYRGSTGFGHEHRECIKADGWGGREQADIRAGVEAAAARMPGLAGRIGIAGNSYGGFSSWFAIARHADLYVAAIPMCGMYKLDIDYHATEMPWGRAYSEEMMGGPPDAFPEKYANASPGTFLDQVRGHILVIHGLADSNVGPENTRVAIREMEAAGIPHRALLFEDEGHGVFRLGNVTTYLDTSDAFFSEAFRKGHWR